MSVINSEDLKKWLIKEKNYSLQKANETILEIELPFPLEQNQIDLINEYKHSRDNLMDETITFKINKYSKKALQTIAKENNMKLSLVIRNAIQCFIDDYYNFERRLQNEKRSREKIDRQRSIQKNSSKH